MLIARLGSERSLSAKKNISARPSIEIRKLQTRPELSYHIITNQPTFPVAPLDNGARSNRIRAIFQNADLTRRAESSSTVLYSTLDRHLARPYRSFPQRDERTFDTHVIRIKRFQRVIFRY